MIAAFKTNGKIESDRPMLARGLLIMLVAVALHNLGAMITHFAS